MLAVFIASKILLHNKAFKADSQRVAFLVLIGLSVYGTMF
ncbi:DUF3265 domain-containing protein [Vibrio parahaemolyticus]|nr:DUF3265 domain-containing protein [Vibrio parahaemolyticus]QHH04023.1 DUF3265 domain-containing protein [Vibrio parahaemolyticus]